jgi:hypothetical protein
MIEEEEEEEQSEFLKTELGSAFVLSDSAEAANAVMSTLDDRLNSVLHNLASMQFFNEFCLTEYAIENVLFWIECEVFKSINDDETRKLFAKYIYLAYIQQESPLKLNVDEEVRNTLLESYDKEPTTEMFEDIQNFVYILIKKHAYNRFENSPLFKRFLEFRAAGTFGLNKIDIHTLKERSIGTLM